MLAPPLLQLAATTRSEVTTLARILLEEHVGGVRRKKVRSWLAWLGTAYAGQGSSSSAHGGGREDVGGSVGKGVGDGENNSKGAGQDPLLRASLQQLQNLPTGGGVSGGTVPLASARLVVNQWSSLFVSVRRIRKHISRVLFATV